MDNKFNMKGQIEVILEDQNGTVKQREVVDNTITDAYLKYVLTQCMTTANLVAATRSAASGNLLSATAPNQFGVYVMSEPITVNPDTYLPPYVDDSRIGLHPSVSFYNVAGATVESAQVMIPVDTRCYYNRAKMEYTLEYVKNTYAGVVRSIAIGRSHTVANNNFIIQQKDIDMPVDLYSTTANYVLEHTTDGTILRKPIGTNEVLTVNLKTKLYTRETNAQAFTNITAQWGALAMNGHLFKVSKKTATGGIYTFTLTMLKDYLTAANTATTLDIAIPTRDGMTVNTAVIPVMVARPNLNKLEVFVTMSIGDHGGQVGANVKKVVIDISDINSLTFETVDMGIGKYAIGNFGITVGQYTTGLFNDGKYYLPYYYVVKSDGSLVNAAIAAWHEGVVLSSDFGTVHNIINFRYAANTFNCPVATDANEVIQMFVNLTTPYIIKLGQLVSGANLENPITKGENDVLRLIYRYKIV
jgi:hypothetical protein